MAQPVYHRLTRDRMPNQFAVVSVVRSSLWLGSDHLLLVQRGGFTETYKRFYFRDIQAITVQETRRRTIWNAVLMVPLGICLIGLVICAIPRMNGVAMIVWAIFGGLFLLPFVVNNLRGTACACQLRTAVQTEEIASLSRVRQTRKVLAKIRPLIVAAQGQLTPEEVSARMQAAVGEEYSATNPEPPAASAPPVQA
jgi:TctA family transporter